MDMKKAGQILLLISGIFTIISAIAVIIGGIVCLVFAGPELRQVIIDGIKDGTITTTIPGTPEEVAAILQSTFLVVGISLLASVIVIVGCAVVAFLGVKFNSKGLYIANIVLGIVGGSIFSLIGGILCLASNE